MVNNYDDLQDWANYYETRPQEAAKSKLPPDLIWEEPDPYTIEPGNPFHFNHRVDTVFNEAQGLLLRKHQDYGPKNISQSPGGPLNGLRVRMWDKMARINNLIDSGYEPANESLRDSFIDLLNYSAIALLVLDGDWPDE